MCIRLYFAAILVLAVVTAVTAVDFSFSPSFGYIYPSSVCVLIHIYLRFCVCTHMETRYVRIRESVWACMYEKAKASQRMNVWMVRMRTRSTSFSRLSTKDNTSLVLLSLDEIVARFCIPLVFATCFLFLQMEICRLFGRAYIKSCRYTNIHSYARTHAFALPLAHISIYGVLWEDICDVLSPHRQLSKSLTKYIFNVHFGEYENRFFFYMFILILGGLRIV